MILTAFTTVLETVLRLENIRLSCQLITCFAVRQSVFQEEWAVAKELSAVSTSEALWMEVFTNSIQAILKFIDIINFKLIYKFSNNKNDLFGMQEWFLKTKFFQIYC